MPKVVYNINLKIETLLRKIFGFSINKINFWQRDQTSNQAVQLSIKKDEVSMKDVMVAFSNRNDKFTTECSLNLITF